jgi:subfamily B ATP-binding cassette protein MsbA
MAFDINKIKYHLREILGKPVPSETGFGYRDLKFFMRFLMPVRTEGALSLALTAAVSGLGALLPLSGKVLIDFVVMKTGFEKVDKILIYFNAGHLIPAVRGFLGSLNLVALSILFIGVSIGLLGMLQRYLVFRFQQEVTFNLQTELFNRMLGFPVSFFKNRQTGYLMSRVSDDVNALQVLLTHNIPHALSRVFYLIFGMAIIFALSKKLALIFFCIMPLYVFINYFFAGRLRGVSRDEREYTARVSKEIQEVISGVETIKAYTAESGEAEKVSGRMRSAVNARVKAAVLTLLSSYSSKGFQLISALIVLWFGAAETLRGGLTVGDFVSLASYTIYLSGALTGLSMFNIMLQPIFASLERLMEIFRTVPEIGQEERSVAPYRPDVIKGEIRFENVFFSYEDKRAVLKDVSFTAPAKKVVAIVGPTGAGKTTIVNLILKFYSPQSGSIFLDGQNLKDIDTGWLRRQIGVVSQDIFLFNDTIERNIRYGSPSATKEDVMEAARNANIHAEIENMTNGYETVVGERGARLSAGQRQRISIARAFLKNPAILILDEPASYLDTETEGLLKESLSRLLPGKTAFIIAHRLSLTEIADSLLVIENGSVVEEGAHNELIGKGGLYSRLFKKKDLRPSG